MSLVTAGRVIQVILLVMQLIERIVTKLHDQNLIDEGYQKALAEQNAKMLAKLNYTKKVVEYIDGLKPDDVDDFLRALEPKQ